MKLFIVLALAVAAASAAPASPDSEAVVVKSYNDNIGIGGYNTEYETSNGIKASEQGNLVDAGTENEALEVQGQFSYIGPDGVLYAVSYTSGRSGFRPEGAHLPQAP